MNDCTEKPPLQCGQGLVLDMGYGLFCRRKKQKGIKAKKQKKKEYGGCVSYKCKHVEGEGEGEAEVEAKVR